MSEQIKICFDYSHGDKLTVESPSFIDFVQFLFNSGYKLGKIEAGLNSLNKIEIYDLLIIGSPYNSIITDEEIDVLKEYVENGGNLLVISNGGGDYANKTNLTELTQNFGIEFNSDRLNDSVYYVNQQKRLIINKFKPHAITEDLNSFVHSGGCSINAEEYSEDENVKVEVIAQAGLNCWREIYNGKEWKEEDSPNLPVVVASKYYKGKVVAIGNVSIFSSLGREYGFGALDNSLLISNILRWLVKERVSEGRIISAKLRETIFYWTKKIMKEKHWENLSDIINFSLKFFKDHYDDVILIVKEEREKKKKAYKRKKKTAAVKKKMEEDKILDLVEVKRDTKDLEDIMSEIEKLSDETKIIQ